MEYVTRRHMNYCEYTTLDVFIRLQTCCFLNKLDLTLPCVHTTSALSYRTCLLNTMHIFNV